MELFILGPAFGLPSIDAECNAAVALLQLRARDAYKIRPTHDQSRRLPCLADGDTRISGFSNIVRHLDSNGVIDEAKLLNTKQRTESLAITSFIESDAPTLLDIGLYVGFENYHHATRPAFTKILPWHANYIIPPQRRAAARTRTEHLGISSIDVDNVHEDMSNRPPGFETVGKESGFEAETQKRASLLLPRKETVRSLLQRPEHAAIFKLHALAENFFAPLQDMLSDQSYLLGSEAPTAVDCLVYGYLALMIYPQVPQDWLASTLKRKYGKLAAYTERIHGLLRLTTNVDDVFGLVKNPTPSDEVEKSHAPKLSLPWQPLAPGSIFETTAQIGRGIWDQIPLVNRDNKLHFTDAPQFSFLERNLELLVLATTASFTAVGYLALRSGLYIWPHGDEVQLFGRKRFADYGHLGAALAGVSILGSQAGGASSV